MKLTFAQVPGFVLKWKNLELTDVDLQALEKLIMQRPEAGDVMQGTGGLRKVRFAPPSWNRGKSGGTRVCYITIFDAQCCYLITLFAKNEKENLSQGERHLIKALIVSIKEYHRPQSSKDVQ